VRALLRKEIQPFLAPAIAGMVLFTGLWLAAFDVEDAFLASPERMLVAVMILALHVGAFLGYTQIAVERDGATLSYLVHRDVPLARLLAAKCLAGWTLLALVVLAPVLACALIERRLDPLGALLRWERVGEIAVGGLAFLPAHALGMFVASLRPAFAWRVLFGSFALGGLGGAIAFLLDQPIPGFGADPGVSRALFALGCAAVAAGFLVAARRGAERLEDAERAPAPAVLATTLAAFALLIVAPGHRVLSITQAAVLRTAAEGEPSLAWHPELGPALVTMERQGRVELGVAVATGVDGRRLAPLSVDPTRSSGRVDDGWIGVWSPDGRLARELWPDLRPTAPFRSAPSIVEAWSLLGGGRVSFGGDPGAYPDSITCYHDRSNGRFLLLSRELPSKATRREPLARSGVASLRALVRGDGRPFSTGSLASTEHFVVSVDDPSDGTTWKCRWLEPGASFERVAAGRYRAPAADASLRAVGRYTPTGWTYADAPPDPEARMPWPPADARVLCEVDGDPLASTVRIVDARTGETLLRRDYGLHGYGGLSVAVFACATELLRAPPALAGAHLFQDPHAAWAGDLPLAGWLTGAGRRPWLALASVALAALLALRARRELARRGAERWRLRAWVAAVLCLGFPGWLAYLLAEPRAAACSVARAGVEPARAGRRSLLIQTSEVRA
jgi:hypothetical protein